MRLFFVLCLMLAATTPTLAQDGLPPGPGRDETRKACGGCHGPETYLGIRRTQEEWETTIQNMINVGMMLSDADYDAVLNYLTVYLGPAPRPSTPPPSP